MDKVIDDLFHAQPDALFMMAGLVFLGISVVGSFKTYFDAGKYGRIAAGVIGLVLVVVGLLMYKPGPTRAAQRRAAKVNAATANDTVAGGAPGGGAQNSGAEGNGTKGNGAREGGNVQMSTLCKFYQGPKAGTTHDFAGKFQPIRVGAVCRDGQGSEGFVVAAEK